MIRLRTHMSNVLGSLTRLARTKENFIFLAITLGLTFSGTHLFAGSSLSKTVEEEKLSKDKKTEIEPFNFEELLPELQNVIIEKIWEELNNHEHFEQQLKSLEENINKTLFIRAAQQGSEIIPIYFNTIANNKSNIIEIGYIDFSRVAPDSASLILKNNNSEYKTTIKINANAVIRACSLSIHGDIAIEWEDTGTNSWNITYISLDDIKPNKEINLNPDFTLKIDKNGSASILFNLEGTKLGISRSTSYKYTSPMLAVVGISPIPVTKNEPMIIDVPCNKKLTIDQIAKRLNIPTSGAKKELEKNRVSNNNNNN